MTLEDEVTTQTSLDLEAITRQAFEILVGFEPYASSPESHVSPDALIAMVGYDESNVGCVIVECNPDLAYEFTSRLMDVERPSSLDANVIDALGELANTVGGNYKGLLSCEVTLTPPTVLQQKEWKRYASEVQIFSEAAYECAYGSCTVRLATISKIQ